MDDNRYLRTMTSLFALLGGAAILYVIWMSPVTAHFNWRYDWTHWVTVNCVNCLVVPLAAAWVFLGLTPSQCGLRLAPLKRSLAWGTALFVGCLPFMLWAAQSPAFQVAYPTSIPARYDTGAVVILLVSIVPYMFAWEFFFRGFLLTLLSKNLGGWAVVAQAVPFCIAHLGKPPAEVGASFFAGLILGFVAWRERSFLPAFIGHALVNVGFNALAVVR